MKIIIGTPMRDWSVGGAHHASMWPLMRACLEITSPQFEIIDPRLLVDDDLVRARSRLVRLFLQHTEGDYLLFVDGDVEVNVGALRGMLAEGVDCIGCTYPKKRLGPYGYPDHYALTISGPTPIQGRRASVDAIGMGFMLLSRDLLETMWAEYDEELGADDEGNRTTMLFMLQFQTDKRGVRHLSPEDYSFCSRVREFTDVWLYTGTGAPLAHEGHHVFRGRAEDVHPTSYVEYEYEDEAGNRRIWGDDRP
jgi:hypothetical protein